MASENRNPNAVIETVLQTIIRFQMISSGDMVVVGFSGGQDSCSLLHILSQLRSTLSFELVAAHVDHGIRGKESLNEMQFCRTQAAQWGVPFEFQCVNVPAHAEAKGQSIQEAARELRHAFLRSLGHAHGHVKIALGHTRSDRSETILMNILRGSGLDGLAAMPPVRDRIIRPLIEMQRTETEIYCRSLGIPFQSDSSNQSLKYLRNRVRQELVPLLRSYYSPDVDDALLRLAEIAEADSSALDKLARSLEQRARIRENAWNREAIASEGIGVVRRVVRLLLLDLRGSLSGIEFSWIERVSQAILVGERLQFETPGDKIRLRVTDTDLRLSEPDPRPMASDWEVEISAPKIYTVPNGNRNLIVNRTSDPPENLPARGSKSVWMDADAIKWPVIMRTRRPGDRIKLLNAPGTRKLQDIMVDRQIPRFQRGKMVLLCDQEGLIWLEGEPPAQRTALTGLTRDFVHFEIQLP